MRIGGRRREEVFAIPHVLRREHSNTGPYMRKMKENSLTVLFVGGMWGEGKEGGERGRKQGRGSGSGGGDRGERIGSGERGQGEREEDRYDSKRVYPAYLMLKPA